MSTSKAIDRICILAAILALLISILFMNGSALGIQSKANTIGYEDRLFDTSKVHTIDIVIDDWETFLETARSEEYSVCSVVIDGEAFRNVGIRGKGNTSLSSVASMDSDRYSFKIEFDQYDSTKTYYGLDKLSLNNLIQDNTMMKDYLVYQMMNEFGVAAPLSSFVYITVNGEDWGLYLAVEAVEESFLQRNYGNDYGELYKPDSMNMGGGRGNGKDFEPENFMDNSQKDQSDPNAIPAAPNGETWPERPEGFPVMPEMPEEFDSTQTGGRMPEQTELAEEQTSPEADVITDATPQRQFDPSQMDSRRPDGKGSSETKLQYIDDNPDSYSTIFSSAKTDVTNADQLRLIQSLKLLSEGNTSAVDVEAVIRYFVVHNYVVNGDSYTGSMIHNYYLYEDSGQLSMIPWDYNLAFGTFQGNQATSAVNDDIDSPLSVTGNDRPMIDWIFSSEEYTELYHQYFQEFLDAVDTAEIISQAKELISPYVQKDPTKFCTYEEFEKAVETLDVFCDLRSQSVALQLAGDEADVNVSSLNLSDMGTMGKGFGGKGEQPGIPGRNGPNNGNDAQTQGPSINAPNQMPQMLGDQNQMGFPEGMEKQEGIEERFPGQDGRNLGNFPERGPMDANTVESDNLWLLVSISAAILLAGMLFVVKFRL